MSAVLMLEDVRKWLGGRLVLDGVALRWDGPGVLVVSGGNGTGKSTLLRIVSGVIAADRGAVLLGGVNLERDRVGALRHIGYLPEAPELPAHVTPRELLGWVASLKAAVPASGGQIGALGVDAILDQPVGTLSLGQRRRVCLLAALVGDPELLVLDEPTNGVDAAGLTMLAELLRERSAAGRSALLATHDAAFIARVADARVELADGRLGEIVRVARA